MWRAESARNPIRIGFREAKPRHPKLATECGRRTSILAAMKKRLNSIMTSIDSVGREFRLGDLHHGAGREKTTLKVAPVEVASEVSGRNVTQRSLLTR
jgi:hypothetical protein